MYMMTADNPDVMLRNMYSSIFRGTKLEQPKICIVDEHGQHDLRQPSERHHRRENFNQYLLSGTLCENNKTQMICD